MNFLPIGWLLAAKSALHLIPIRLPHIRKDFFSASLMRMAMMRVGVMRMAVGLRLMSMKMRMRLLHPRVVLMRVVCVIPILPGGMGVRVFVLQNFVVVPVGMVLGQV